MILCVASSAGGSASDVVGVMAAIVAVAGIGVGGKAIALVTTWVGDDGGLFATGIRLD